MAKMAILLTTIMAVTAMAFFLTIYLAVSQSVLFMVTLPISAFGAFRSIRLAEQIEQQKAKP